MTFTLEPTSDGVDLVVRGDWTPEAAACFHEGVADGIVVNYALGFREKDLEFLRGLPIRRVRILARWLTDLSPLYSIPPGIVSLRVESNSSATLELERFPLLRELSTSWSQVQGSLRYAQELQTLYLNSYTEKDLEPIAYVRSLVSISIKERAHVQSLDGLEALPWLRVLGIYVARKLHDISALARSASPVLETLRLSFCQKVSDVTPVAACSALTFFEFSECGDILSVVPLGELRYLERLYLYGTTKILDGDLRPLSALPSLRDLRLKSRPNYSPPRSELEQHIVNRQQRPPGSLR
jgi:hypothetical protein